jgi:hypothetical protein
VATLGRGGEFEGTLQQAVEEARGTLGALEEEFLGWSFEGRSMDSDLLKPCLEISREGLLGPGLQAQTEAKAGDQGAIDAQIQARKQFLVANQDQGKGRLGVGAGTGEQAEFFEGGGIEILGLFDDDDRPQGRPFLPKRREQEDIVAATVLGFLAAELTS